jgi:hypothetical protein
MSLTGKFNELTIDQNADTDMGEPETLPLSQNPSAPPASAQTSVVNKMPRKPKRPKDVFTFVTIYYKHGEWDTCVFDTLRDGLLEFVRNCDSAAEREILISLDDEELTERMLIMGAYSGGDISNVAYKYNYQS